MTTFDDRERAFENKYAYDTEMQFKAEARRNRLLGEWAAGELGIHTPDEIEAYAKSVVRADFEEPGHEDVVRKVMGDFTEKAVGVTEETLRAKMAELLAVAKAQLADEFKA
ncbi:MAG: DUF1476 domain-containing protein [Pseudomonadota bacterium]